MEVKPLKYKQLPGISEKQLTEHHDVLYAGYVKKVDEIRQKLAENPGFRDNANATHSDFRELKSEETFALNGVRLHEYYFDNLGGNGKANGTVAEWIAKDFGSIEAWEKDFKACGVAGRGWAVLSFDLNDGKLHNFICDAHNQGGVWWTVPLLILDVYEHAYFIDYGTTRKKYLDAFMQNIDWAFVNALIEKFHLKAMRK